MKKIIWQLVLPLTVISFEIFTKWWFVLVEDGPSEILTGFPLPYFCSGWHTSLSLQIFVTELVIDVFTYFIFWFLIVFIINKYVYKFKPHKIRTRILLISSGLILALNILIASNPDNIFTIKRDFNIQILDEGFDVFKIQSKYPELADFVLIQKDYKKKLNVKWDNLTVKDNMEISFISVQKTYPYLGGYYPNRIEKINFIDSIYILDKSYSKRLLELIKDSNNLINVNTESNRFIANSGFIFTKNDTLFGSINMTYDYKHIEFSPKKNDSNSWTLTEAGLSKMEKLITELKE
jgi:hypothetical protein